MKRLLQVTALGVLMAVSAVNCQKKTPGTGMQSSGSGGLRSIYFDFDNSFIRQDQTAILQGDAAYLKSSSGAVTIEGSCDERGSNEYNLALGQRRADAARDYLSNLGVNPGMMRTVSFGEERSVCFEHDESCWWKNRRVDFRK